MLELVLWGLLELVPNGNPEGGHFQPRPLLDPVNGVLSWLVGDALNGDGHFLFEVILQPFGSFAPSYD